MKTITINFTAQTVVSSYDLGRIGEHNATELVITPPTSLSGDSRTALYRVQFRTGSEIVTSESYTEVPFTVALWQQLTEHSRLSLQVVAYDANGEYIGKSDKLSGFYFNASVSGTLAEADEQLHGLEAEIAENTAARHTHSNKPVLDELDEDINGDLTYKGNGFATDAELALKQDILTAGNNITIDSDNVISADIDNTREIATANNPYLSTYTPAELKAFYDAGLLLTYTNKPLVWGSYEGGTFHFGLVYTSRNGDVIHYWTDAYVNASKVITLSTEQTAVRSVNSKLAGNANGNVTLQAGDISAASGWAPSADTDLATKKYVDDNTGGSPDWSDIQNKPNFATVATSGDYDDLINKPTIPAAQIQADWNEADNTALDYIKNKPATMPPTAHTHTKSDITDFPSLATVATSGSYNDLLNQPTIPDISGCEVTTNKVTSLSNLSTDTQYPSAKCVYDLIGDVESILADLIGGA